MTETTVNAEVGKILDNKIPNLTLNDLLMKHAMALNAPNWSPSCTETDRLLRTLLMSCTVFRAPVSGSPLSPMEPPSHSPEFIAAGKSEEAHQAVQFGAKILADAALELIDDPKQLEAIQKEFKKKERSRGKESLCVK